MGYIYGGAGENFVLPDLVGRMPLGKSGLYLLGEIGGAEEVALITAQLPAHGHNLSVGNGGGHAHTITSYTNNDYSGVSGHLFTGVGDYPWQRINAYPNSPTPVYAASTGNVGTSIDGNHTHGGIAVNTGSGQGHNNMPPFLSLNFIIKA